MKSGASNVIENFFVPIEARICDIASALMNRELEREIFEFSPILPIVPMMLVGVDNEPSREILKVLLTMALNTTVIASSVSEFRELSDRGVLGLLSAFINGGAVV
ncbi:hypothetical protein ALQ19_200063 [Pseudomonas syringae pv. berberidis]|nr:hypothetical protein ALQ19_200063 [Pseudomonas syringae pv. berberidis]